MMDPRLRISLYFRSPEDIRLRPGVRQVHLRGLEWSVPAENPLSCCSMHPGRRN